MNLLLKKLIHILRVIYFEMFSLSCCLVGLIKVKFLFSKGRINRLEIGAGKSKKEGFFSLDLDFTSDFPFDLRVGMPFSDNSIDFIYAEHVLEHFQYEEVMLVLLECKRVMRNGGVFKISVPDARIYLKGYSCPGNFNTKKFCTFDAGLDLDVAINIVNYMCYMSGHHRFMFDEDSLAQILRSVGFSNVGIREFDAELDQLSRRHESIYAQCVKL